MSVVNDKLKNHNGCVYACTRSLRLKVGPKPFTKLRTDLSVIPASSVIKAVRISSVNKIEADMKKIIFLVLMFISQGEVTGSKGFY